MNPEPSFEEIRIRMERLGVDRQWLSDQTHYSLSSIANALAPKGNPASKTESALNRMWEALDREEERQAAAKNAPEPEPLSSLVLRVDSAEFDDWNRAALAQSKIVSAWAIDCIRDAYQAEMAAGKSIPFKTPVHVSAAAGPAIEAEVVETVDSVIRVRICGLSMDPLLPDGSVVSMHSRIASRSPFMKKGLIYLVRIDGAFAVKRFATRKPLPEEVGEEWAAKGRVGLLESVNPDYAPIVIRGEIEWLAWLDPKEIPNSRA